MGQVQVRYGLTGDRARRYTFNDMKISPLVLVFVLAACGNGDNGNGNGDGLQDDGPLLCPDTYTTGRGKVWRGNNPYKLTERDLPCLEGNGTLSGYYISSIRPSPGETAQSDEEKYLYDSDDARVNQVQAYYVITHMANWLIGYFVPAEDYTNTIDALRSDRVSLDYNRAEVESLQDCITLNMGMQRLDDNLLNVDVFAHEFGHHIVFSLSEITNGMIHEALSDYLAASFTQDSTIEPSDWSGFDRDLDNNHKAPQDVILRGEYCSILLGRMEADGIDQEYPSLANTFRNCYEPQVPEHHWASMILSGALWELRSEIGDDELNPVLFSALHRYAPNDTGDLMNRLIEEDAALNAGGNQDLIRDVFTARGIDQNLNLGFRELSCP
jgi:hypothetical protein